MEKIAFLIAKKPVDRYSSAKTCLIGFFMVFLRKIFIFAFAFSATAFGLCSAETVYLVPYDPSVTTLKQCRLSPALPESDETEWEMLGSALDRMGYQLKIIHLQELLGEGDSSKFLEGVEKIIFINTPNWLGPNWQSILQKIPREKKVLLAAEPPTILPEMYSKEIVGSFEKILTWDDSLVDDKLFFKIPYPVLIKTGPGTIPFAQKKFLTQISRNKWSPHPNELYSERKKVIEYFEQMKDPSFEFYGQGWEGAGYANYRGSINDKFSVLKHFRFCMCYENIKDIPGYITEKIFDCFACDSVPIYWGASNVTDYIPRSCFIDRKDYPSMDLLVAYLKNMPETEYNEYIANIHAFLKSRTAFTNFSLDAFVAMVVTLILK